ncbi:MAG: carboxylesterase family protein, partial [Myxococcota bacterium]
MFRLTSTGIIVMLMGTLSCGEDATEGSSDVGTGQGDTQNASEDMGVGDDTARMDTGLSGGDDDGGQGDTEEMVACPLEMMEPEAGVVATDRGYVQGTQMSGGIWSFRGMPYAAPPVDDLRWAEPEPAACWNGVHMADSFGPKCPQLEVTRQGTSVIGDEDCLTINVWTPSDGLDSQQRRPVMMFIHGGGNIIGSSSEEIAPGRFLYEGQPLAERGDVVVVTFNYRLGPLGYMKLPQLDAESSVGVSGNYGLKDQIAALQWVQRNIASFGGDPDRVMLFGESAGGVNTCMMLSSPLAGGLFHRALIQSAACPAVTAEVAEETSVQALELANCSDDPEPLACIHPAHAG